MDRSAKKTYGTGASWVDVPIDDIWLSPSPQEQVPPVVFTEKVGSWLREHPIETHLFVFGTAKQLKEGSELQQALAAAAPRSDTNPETSLIHVMYCRFMTTWVDLTWLIVLSIVAADAL